MARGRTRHPFTGLCLFTEGALTAALGVWGWTRWLPQLRTPETIFVLVIVAIALIVSFVFAGVLLVCGVLMLRSSSQAVLVFVSAFQLPVLGLTGALAMADAKPWLFALATGVVLVVEVMAVQSLVAERRR